MTDNLKLNVDAYLPLRDVVFHTLREAILKGRVKTGGAFDGIAACIQIRSVENTDP